MPQIPMAPAPMAPMAPMAQLTPMAQVAQVAPVAPVADPVQMAAASQQALMNQQALLMVRTDGAGQHLWASRPLTVILTQKTLLNLTVGKFP